MSLEEQHNEKRRQEKQERREKREKTKQEKSEKASCKEEIKLVQDPLMDIRYFPKTLEELRIITKCSAGTSWTTKELVTLMEGVHMHGYGKWFDIAKMIKSKSNRQVCNKYRNIMRKKLEDRSKLSLKFCREEDQEILEWVQQFGTGQWDRLGQKIGRVGSSCMTRYWNFLNPHLRKGRWDDSEKIKLLELYKIHGKNWAYLREELQRSIVDITDTFYSTLVENLNRILFRNSQYSNYAEKKFNVSRCK